VEIGPATVRVVFDVVSQNFATSNFGPCKLTCGGWKPRAYATSKLKVRVRVLRLANEKASATVIPRYGQRLVEAIVRGESMPLVRHLVDGKTVDRMTAIS